MILEHRLMVDAISSQQEDVPHSGNPLLPEIAVLSSTETEALRQSGQRWAATVPPADPRELGRANPLAPDVVHGSLPGNIYTRIHRHTRDFEAVEPGMVRATLHANQSQSGLGRALDMATRVLFGNRLSVAAFAHERLTKVKALAVLSSDAISSVAYATEQILLVLLAVGSASFWISLPVGCAIVALMVIVGISYRQTIRAYPRGGGSYIVAKDNLGDLPGLIAAAALMTDYTLTVAVSVASGIAAMVSAYPSLAHARVALGVACIVLIGLGNLRGIREAGTLFAVPTYAFVLGMYLLIGKGLWDLATGHAQLSTALPVPATQGVALFLILRAFSNGCSAMTGVEAISDGVPAFQPPEWKNARTTLSWMVGILATIFLGVTFLAHQYGVQPDPTGAETLLSRLARLIVGDGTLIYYYLQYTTFLILVLAANTAFSDFPRLLYFLSRDSFAPRLFRKVGGRLAFSNGIVTLAGLAILLYVAFGGLTDALIPLYTIGVFTSFTLSQFGMVLRWRRLREAGWRTAMFFNGLGAIVTLLVLAIATVSKFLEGAWFVIVLIPILVSLFLAIRRHYFSADRELAPSEPVAPSDFVHTMLCPLADLNYPALRSLAYARSITPHVIAVHISVEEQDAYRLRQKWDEWGNYVPLEIIESPYRGVIVPLLTYIDAIRDKRRGETMTVVLPEYIARHWWESLLHNQTAFRIKAALLFRPDVIVTNVPYHLRGQVPSTVPYAQRDVT